MTLWIAQGFGIGRIPVAPGTFGSLLGLVWFGLLLMTGNLWWFVGACLIFANWPYTLISILPVNKRLAAMAAGTAEGDKRVWLEKWGRLHAGRSVLGCLSVAAYLWASL